MDRLMELRPDGQQVDPEKECNCSARGHTFTDRRPQLTLVTRRLHFIILSAARQKCQVAIEEGTMKGHPGGASETPTK
jgi:hypothetical protein